MKAALCALALAAMAAPAAGQTVFKCKAADGSTIYSQTACAADPDKVERKEVRWAGRADPSAVAALEQETARAQMLRAESRCVSQREGPIRDRLDRQVREYSRQIANYEREIERSANNQAGATRDLGFRELIAALHTSIAEAQSSADRQIIEARRACQTEADLRAAPPVSPDP